MGVTAMLAKLDRKPMERTRMQPLQKPFYHELRTQIQSLDLRGQLRLQVLLDGNHAVSPLWV